MLVAKVQYFNKKKTQTTKHEQKGIEHVLFYSF